MANKTFIKEENNVRYFSDGSWIDLGKLKRREIGKGDKKRSVADYKASIGCIIPFYFNKEFNGEFEIVDVVLNEKSKPVFKLKHKDVIYEGVKYSAILNCGFSAIFGLISTEYKYNIGDIIEDDFRKLLILDLKRDDYGARIYKVKCLKCGFGEELYYNRQQKLIKNGYCIHERNLIKGEGCPCCRKSPQVISPNINSIFATNKEMFELLLNKEDGYKYAEQSNKSVYFKCPNCGSIKKKRIQDVCRHGLCCDVCSDGISSSEKYMRSLLLQSNVQFVSQYSPEWIKPKKYDFYLPDYNVIVEIHGEQHRKGWGTKDHDLEYQIQNDTYKRNTALDNGVDTYIEIDYNCQQFDEFKENIMTSKLSNLIPLENVYWGKCMNDSLKSISTIIWEMWNNKKDINISTMDLSKELNVDKSTISRYLKLGNELGICEYDIEEEKRKGLKKARKSVVKRCSKPVEVFKDGVSVGVYPSASELARVSEEKLGVKLIQTAISAVCRGEYKGKQHKGFTYKYANVDIDEFIK